MANNAIFDIATANVIDADFSVITPNANANNISTSYERVNSIFPTSSVEFYEDFWNNRSLPWEGTKYGIDLSHSHIITTEDVLNLAGINFGFKMKQLCGIDNLDEFIKTIYEIAATGIIPNGFIESIGTTPEFGVYRDDRPANRGFLGSGSKRYVPLGNEHTRELCDILYHMGFVYENAGCFDNGKITYVSMKWKEKTIAGEKFDFYVVIVNSFDQSLPFGVFITDVRISCKNTLNLAIKKATRFWKLKHTKNAHIKLEEVKEGLKLFGNYIGAFDMEVNRMKLLTCDKDKVVNFISTIFPIKEGMSARQISNTEDKRAELLYRWEYAPDLKDMEQSAFRFMSAVADYQNHNIPKKKTDEWKDNRFKKDLVNNDIIDTAYTMINSL